MTIRSAAFSDIASSAAYPWHGVLAALGAHTHPASMTVVTEAEAATARAAFEQRGELSAAVELCRLFPAITDTAQARACAKTIAAGTRAATHRPATPPGVAAAASNAMPIRNRHA